jgi:hypothetical protein
MKIYLIFLSTIYHFYVKKKDKMPDAMTFWLSTTILTLNFFALYDFLGYYIFKEIPFDMVFGFSSFGIIALINYVLFFVKRLYRNIETSKKNGFYAIIFIVITFIAVIYIGSLHRERNLQEKQQIERRL